MTAEATPGPPPRPLGAAQRLAFFFLTSFAPRVPRVAPADPPPPLAPYERFTVPHALRPAPLDATWFAAEGTARGAVLLAHPWVPAGQAYFHRYSRIPALRRAGYHVATFDLPGFGGSGARRGYYDEDVEQMLDVLARRAPGLPWHYWGVSSGGVWGMVLLARRDAFAGAMFEDVGPHLLEWAWRAAPRWRPAYWVHRTFLRRGYAFLDLRRHAPSLRVRAAAMVVGADDPGIPTADARRLADLARAELLVVPGAGHLQSIRVAADAIVALALRTFEAAVAR